jgi:DNA polymerase-3 subunit gamma/tau
LFGEEDLTRHLQIMLRTHSELGYKQEQRFHLELGLLKMAHAQRLLPIEQLLSEVAASPAGTAAPRATARPSLVGKTANSPETRGSDPTPAARPNYVSPFAADSARKGSPKQEALVDPAPTRGPHIVAGTNSPSRVIMGAAAPQTEPAADPRNAATATLTLEPEPVETMVHEPQPTTPGPSESSDQIERVQGAVLQALTDDNQRVLVSMLGSGEWSVQGNELVVKVTESQTVVDMSLGSDARRVAIACASGVLGRPVKLKIVPGATAAPAAKRNGASGQPSGPAVGGRGRAEQDPVVQQLREKFGAEIRTVIDYKEKR